MFCIIYCDEMIVRHVFIFYYERVKHDARFTGWALNTTIWFMVPIVCTAIGVCNKSVKHDTCFT